jgi:hypothetical protein
MDRMTVARILGSRIVQFLAVGGALWALSPGPQSPSEIAIRGERLQALREAEAARAGGLLLDGGGAVDRRAIEDEVLYREGVRLGLDRNDGIVRQRVVQKVLFLAEELGGATRAPDERELRAFFDEERGRWARPERWRIEQRFRNHRGALDAWAQDRSTLPPPGEAAPVEPVIDADRPRLLASLGAGFVAALAGAPTDPSRWLGPIPSAYGFHLVRVLAHEPERPARFEEVRAEVAEALVVRRRREATAAFLRDAFARYHVTVDGKPLAGFAPTGRLAFRSVASGED